MFEALEKLKGAMHRPGLKYPLIAIASVLWLVGLVDQISDPMQLAKYVGLSALIAAVMWV
ncbi:MAG: hypothetical protein KGI70_00560 [Patescibacteria group bacterium]|nr:hypothetical protein [Patescibacteria group bacterium]